MGIGPHGQALQALPPVQPPLTHLHAAQALRHLAGEAGGLLLQGLRLEASRGDHRGALGGALGDRRGPGSHRAGEGGRHGDLDLAQQHQQVEGRWQLLVGVLWGDRMRLRWL